MSKIHVSIHQRFYVIARMLQALLQNSSYVDYSVITHYQVDTCSTIALLTQIQLEVMCMTYGIHILAVSFVLKSSLAGRLRFAVLLRPLHLESLLKSRCSIRMEVALLGLAWQSSRTLTQIIISCFLVLGECVLGCLAFQAICTSYR